MLDLLISGGRVVTGSGVGMWDVAVSGDKIAAVLEPGAIGVDAARVVDAAGKIVLPGGIEPHSHCNYPIPAATAEGIELRTGGPEEVTRACLFGGTTTLVDFAYWRPGIDIFEAIEEQDEVFRTSSYADYSFHVALYSREGDLPFSIMEQVEEAVAGGFPSTKLFTTNTTPSRRPNQICDFGHMWQIMDHAVKAGGTLAVHAEDEDIVMFMYRKLNHLGRYDTAHLGDAHNNVSEDIAFRRVIRLAEHAGASVYFMHVTAKEGVDAIAEARSRGLPVQGEVCHQNLCFNSDIYEQPDAALYTSYATYKSETDREALWQGILDGHIATTATDELFVPKAVKLRGSTIDDTTGGSEGVETRMGIVYAEGVVKRNMSLTQFADVTSTNAAKLLGLYPRKGVIAPGSDADLAILDPDIHKRLELTDLHGTDYSIWQGWEIHGWPVTTIVRGRVMVDNGEFFGEPGYGQLVPRKISREVLACPLR